MENVPSTFSPAHVNALPRARTTALTDPSPTVVITSVLTETVHPTLVKTETTVVTQEPVTAQTATARPETTAVETIQSETHQPQTTQLETTRSETVLQQTIQQDTSSATPTSVKVSSSLMEEQPTSHSTEYWAGVLGHLNAHTSASNPAPGPPVPSSSSSSQPPLTIPTSTSASALSSTPTTETSASIAQLTSTSTSPSQSSSSSPSSSPTSPPFTNIISGSASTKDPAGQAQTKSTNVGAIVGGTIGGAAFIALGLLACFLFFRRKRQTAFHPRQFSRQSLLHPRDPSRPVHGLRNRQVSEPTLPIVRPPTIPSAPVFPPRRHSNPLGCRPDPALATSNRDVSLDETHSRGEDQHLPSDLFADPEKSPVSPIIEVFPPSHTTSLYSRSSWESGRKLLGCHVRTSRTSAYESTYYPGESTLTIPDNGNDSESFTPSRNRASTRSDPFDLEPPPNVLHNWPL